MSVPRNLEVVDETLVELHTHTTGLGVTMVESLTVNNMDASACWVKIWRGDSPAPTHAGTVPTWERRVPASEERDIPVYAVFGRGCYIAVGAQPGADATAPTTGARITAILGEV